MELLPLKDESDNLLIAIVVEVEVMMPSANPTEEGGAPGVERNIDVACLLFVLVGVSSRGKLSKEVSLDICCQEGVSLYTQDDTR
jgi:hypothetical protein